MDPRQQQLNQLDPKLKEAYEKVMGIGQHTPVNPAPLKPAEINPVTSTSQPMQPVVIPVATNLQPPAQPATAPAADTGGWVPPAPPSSTQPIQTRPIPTPQAKSAIGAHGFVAKKRSTIPPVIIILGVVIFLAVYTLFWMKFFSIKIPFLP